MEIDRKTAVEIVVSAAAVLFFIGVVFVVGTTYGTNGDISGQGGLAVVGSIVLFVLVMTGVGAWLSRQEF
jgi:peptidoglycan/LPS O-acetylase OafA/YrhL